MTGVELIVRVTVVAKVRVRKSSRCRLLARRYVMQHSLNDLEGRLPKKLTLLPFLSLEIPGTRCTPYIDNEF